MAFRRSVRNTQPELIAHARQMRREPTPAEAILWEALQGRKLGGLKFRRQHPVNAYILDFWCSACKLVVELDGSVHESSETRAHDEMRQRHLEEAGYTVLRFRNEEVLENLSTVLNIIRAMSTPLC